VRTIAEFVSLDPQGIITKETWRATGLCCPRCGRGEGTIWTLTSQPPLQVQGLVLPVFLCVACLHVAIGLNGFQPKWTVEDRAKQIISQAFQSETE
jgi:hypothetical protein